MAQPASRTGQTRSQTQRNTWWPFFCNQRTRINKAWRDDCTKLEDGRNVNQTWRSQEIKPRHGGLNPTKRLRITQRITQRIPAEDYPEDCPEDSSDVGRFDGGDTEEDTSIFTEEDAKSQRNFAQHRLTKFHFHQFSSPPMATPIVATGFPSRNH